MNIMTDEEVFASSLPLTEDQISSCRWSAYGSGPGGLITAHINESADHPGYFYCRVVAVGGCSESKRPILAKAVGIQMDNLLSHYGVKSSGLKWFESASQVHASAGKKGRKSDEVVYVLRAGDFIKIGKASGNAENRVTSLQTGCPFPIEVLAVIPGGLEREARLHRVFSSLRAHGEWFHASPSLIRFIRRASVRYEVSK